MAHSDNNSLSRFDAFAVRHLRSTLGHGGTSLDFVNNV